MDPVELRRKKVELLYQAIEDGGFYGSNGVWNSIKKFPGDETIYRERVETIIVKNGKEVFVKKRPDNTYYLPGGSTERDISNIEQAINECKEEARINVKNIKYTGITYKEKVETPEWAKEECTVEWNGHVTEVYVAEYDSHYKGEVDEEDRDPFIQSGSFISTKECFRIFRKEHQQALLQFIKEKNNKEETMEESYIGNYFKNKRFLKQIGGAPEITSSLADQILHLTKKRYDELKNSSRVKREIKNGDAAMTFYPVIQFEFPDKKSITVSLCFDKEEFSEGMAFHSKEHGDIVALFAHFFNLDKDEQLFVLLHEIGHVRLAHLEERNQYRSFFGGDRDRRRELMRKGKAVYTEVNADLYAVLNGAAMYSILNMNTGMDKDENYDYRYTNQELADRHTQVFHKYNNLRDYTRKNQTKRILESEEVKEENVMDNYVRSHDIALLTIYDLVYESESTLGLSEKEKEQLFHIIYESTVGKYVKNDPRVIEAKEQHEKAKAKLKALKADESRYNKLKAGNYVMGSKEDLDFIKKYDEEEHEGLLGTNGENHATKIVSAQHVVDDLGIRLARIKAEVTDEYRTAEKAKKKEAFDEFVVKAKDKANEAGKKIGKLVQRPSQKVVECVEERTYWESVCSEAIADLYNVFSERAIVNETSDHILTLLESVNEEVVYGIPETKSYPLDTKKHVISAIRLFGHSEEKYRPELSKAIFKAMNKYNISKDVIGEKSPLYNYL